MDTGLDVLVKQAKIPMLKSLYAELLALVQDMPSDVDTSEIYSIMDMILNELLTRNQGVSK